MDQLVDGRQYPPLPEWLHVEVPIQHHLGRIVALLLAGSGWLNVTLNTASARSTVATSSLLRLDAALHQEGTLQWRALAERGAPTRMAADVGYVRAAEAELVAQLEELLSRADVADVQEQIDEYHTALYEELSLLAVGRTDDAFAFEREVTAPRFAALNGWLRVSEAAVRHQAEHDPLTGLPNRSMFSRSLDAAAASTATAVLFVDLDGFKAVNDAWGHAVGDQLLIEVGARLRPRPDR